MNTNLNITEIPESELAQVSGGILFLPVVASFGKGLLLGGGIAALVLDFVEVIDL